MCFKLDISEKMASMQHRSSAPSIKFKKIFKCLNHDHFYSTCSDSPCWLYNIETSKKIKKSTLDFLLQYDLLSTRSSYICSRCILYTKSFLLNSTETDSANKTDAEEPKQDNSFDYLDASEPYDDIESSTSTCDIPVDSIDSNPVSYDYIYQTIRNINRLPRDSISKLAFALGESQRQNLQQYVNKTASDYKDINKIIQKDLASNMLSENPVTTSNLQGITGNELDRAQKNMC